MRLAPLVATLVMATGSVAAAAADGAEAVTVAELISDPDRWAGVRVAVTGELVGDYSARPEGVWVQLNDDPYAQAPVGVGGSPIGANVAVGALIPVAVFDAVEGPPGRYGRQGPLVRLEGIFVDADPDLGGETYLRVDAATTLRPAATHPLPGPDRWLAVGMVLIAVALGMGIPARRTRVR